MQEVVGSIPSGSTSLRENKMSEGCCGGVQSDSRAVAIHYGLASQQEKTRVSGG
jgi:hypothetical protein